MQNMFKVFGSGLTDQTEFLQVGTKHTNRLSFVALLTWRHRRCSWQTYCHPDHVSYIRFKTFRTKGLSLQQLILVLVGNAFDHRWTLYIGHWTLYILSLPFSSNLPAASFLISRMWNCLARNTQRTGWVWNGLTFQSIKRLFVQAMCSTLHSSGCLRIEEHQWQGAQQQHMVASLRYVVRFSLELVVAFMGVKGLGFTCQAWMWSSPIMHLKCSSTFVRTIHWASASNLQWWHDRMFRPNRMFKI